MRKYLAILAVVLLVISACGKKKSEAVSIEQIHKEQGVPVKVITIEPGSLSQEQLYNATISGAEESTSNAMLADVVTGIHAQIGDRVSKGQLIISFPANSPMAQNDQARAGFNSARQVYERMQRLHTQGAISQQDLDNARTGFEVAQANLQSSEAMIKIVSPINGILTNIMVNNGDRCYLGQPLFTVASGGSFKAVVNVPESEISKVRRGTPATATWNGITLNGRVTQVALALDPNTKAFRVECVFPNSNRGFSYGVTAQVSLITSNVQNVIAIDRQYIVTENSQKFVWLAKDGKAVKAPIETGRDNQLRFEVVSGLTEGDVLITEGLNLLTDNAKINVVSN